MSAMMNLGENPSESRLNLALELIQDGRCVDIDGYGVAVVNGEVQVFVYIQSELDKARAQQRAGVALNDLDRCLAQFPCFSRALKTLPRRTIFVRDYGTGACELGHLDGHGQAIWL